MIYSMTGFGRGEAKCGEGTVAVDVRTVNHRYLDFSIRLPRAMNGYERDVEKAARARIKRGHVYVTASFDAAIEAGAVQINRDLLRAAYRALTEFAIEEGIPGKVDINTLLSIPDSFALGNADRSPESLWEAVARALDAALEGCLEMRAVEGAELARDILKRLTILDKAVARIEKRAPRAQKAALARARQRLAQVTADRSFDESRWMMEAALLADRLDFSEELVRIGSHLRQFRAVVEKGDEVSKKLTFLLQEIHREATTMGNKAADSAVIGECLSIKEGVEKIREQVQNLE